MGVRAKRSFRRSWRQTSRSVQAWQHQVQNDDVGGIPACFGQCDSPVGRITNFVAFLLQVIFEKFDQITFIFDDQNFFLHTYPMPQKSVKLRNKSVNFFDQWSYGITSMFIAP